MSETEKDNQTQRAINGFILARNAFDKGESHLGQQLTLNSLEAIVNEYSDDEKDKPAYLK